MSPELLNYTVLLRYEMISYIYVRPKADKQPASSAAQNQQTKRVMKKTKKQNQDTQKKRSSNKVRRISPGAGKKVYGGKDLWKR